MAIPSRLVAGSDCSTKRSLSLLMPAGKAIVATRLLTHTQVLSDQTAILTAATAEEFAAGILTGLNEPARSAALGQRAQELADTKYSYEAYLTRTRQACAHLTGEVAPQVAGGIA